MPIKILMKSLSLLLIILYLPSIAFGNDSFNDELCIAASMTSFSASSELKASRKMDKASAISIYNKRLSELTAKEGQNKLLQMLTSVLEPYIKYGLCQSLKNPSMSTEAIKLNARRICSSTVDSGMEKMQDSEVNCLFK